MMKKIALIYMGGTFGCIGDPLSPMPAVDFIPQLQHVLPLDQHIECFVAPVIQDSSACTATDWLKLVQYIQQLQLQQFQHFVIIHGTDTLSYASAILARFLGQSSYVVLTGSQYPLLNSTGDNTREFSDAIDNLNFALDTVIKAPVGVYLAFHHQLFHAQTALKIHTSELDAFTGQKAEQTAQQATQSYVVQDADIQKAASFNCLSLMMQPIDLDQQVSNLQTIAQSPPHCLILQGFGSGNLAVNDPFMACLQNLQQAGCAVVLTTQVPFGGINQHYAISQWIQQSNILLSDCAGHADLYAKALKMYLQYDAVDQWQAHWHDHG
ncbi:asparaginase domain-containing protein [Acinetobacter bouvetii]|uniref:L-asparaginase 1 n=1 Tax=Acinetobacter bouvetii TaxID=202951 RepID=A0A811G669_9GAMM|nr:asparaginase domain-containing protein [Acinetobacter bouvetii]CAB1208438.1 L-asparaginase 1 [Acinetobacter bouvetii]